MEIITEELSRCKNCDTPAEDCGNTEIGRGMLECCDFCDHRGR